MPRRDPEGSCDNGRRDAPRSAPQPFRPTASAMQFIGPDSTPIARDIDVFAALVPLASARIVELGCGAAELPRALATRHPDARITAFEVDRIQHAKNLAAGAPPNVEFGYGSADAIPLPDASCDVVLMAKSLHHVDVPAMDAALAEIARVLVPGGHAAFSEPVYAGEFNALMAIFHDEKRVREAAFGALLRAVAAGRFELVAERFHTAERRFADFADFERRMIGVTHTAHRLTPGELAAVRERFAQTATPAGALFHQPMRVDVLRKPVGALTGAV